MLFESNTKDNKDILSLQIRWNNIRIANIYDALENMGFSNQCLDLSIRPFIPSKHLAGMAITVRGVRDPMDYDGNEKFKDVLFKGSPNLLDFIYPGSVLVIDGGDEKTAGKMGEMTCWSFKQAGAKGVVIDGYIRDRLGLDAIDDFCVCAKGTSPIESNKRWHVDSVNIPITISGTLTSQVPIYPGDWIIGGDDGVIVVPQKIANEVLTIAEDIENRENGMRKDLFNGENFMDTYKKWGRS